MVSQQQRVSSNGRGNRADDAPTQDIGNGRSLLAQCPNPSCGMVSTVPVGWEGKKGRCPRCGSTVPFPNSNSADVETTESHETNGTHEENAQRAAGVTDKAVQADAESREQDQAVVVRAGCIGRGNAGKTALFRALEEGPVGDFFPSGLHVDVGDPREVARMIRESENTRKLLLESGLPPTLEASQLRYYIYDGSEQRVTYQMHEVIGQVLTHTLPDSATDQQSRYDDYLSRLVNTQVLWAVVPSPLPNAGTRERRRYANDLRITVAYLREALRLRSREQPVAVALVLSKIDTLYNNEDEARSSMTDEKMRQSLGPLVDLVTTSSRVDNAAIFPVTSFGFGKAVMRDEAAQRDGMPAESKDEPFGGEPVWILRDGEEADAFNLDALFLWTLEFGLHHQKVAANKRYEIAGIIGKLRNDLIASDPWILPLKSSERSEPSEG